MRGWAILKKQGSSREKEEGTQKARQTLPEPDGRKVKGFVRVFNTYTNNIAIKNCYKCLA
jgi:hypothetical protein